MLARNALNPVLDFPGRERLQPPLLPAVRRPMAETRRLLDHFLDRARHDPAPLLLRRLADHIDEFGFVGHGGLSSRLLAPAKSAPNCLTTPFNDALMLKGKAPSMIRTRRAAPTQSGNRFSLATNAERLRGDHAQTK